MRALGPVTDVIVGEKQRVGLLPIYNTGTVVTPAPPGALGTAPGQYGGSYSSVGYQQQPFTDALRGRRLLQECSPAARVSGSWDGPAKAFRKIVGQLS